MFGKRGNESVFKWNNASGETSTLLPENALPIFKAKPEEKAHKVSSKFYETYIEMKKGLFGSQESSPSKTRSKALIKVKSWQNDNIPEQEDYLKYLYAVIELDGLPDYSRIIRAKSCDELKDDISMPYLEKILDTSDSIDTAPENVILAEEIR